MDFDFESLFKQGQAYAEMRQEMKSTSNPDEGEPGWLISFEWMNKYYKYIQYDRIKNKLKPERSQEHYAKNYPGPITNYDIVENDQNKYLVGTG